MLECWKGLDPMRQLFLEVLWSHLGEPYIWGGDDPSGFDCSGFIIEGLKSVGLVPAQYDNTAAGLAAEWLRAERYIRPGEGMWRALQPGDLSFWMGSNGKISHVEAIVMVAGAATWQIGAKGGGSKTTTRAEAWKQNAYIKVRPVGEEVWPAWRFYRLL